MYRMQQPHHSQNFLRSRELAKQLVRASSITHTDTVLEIGPGQGILTHELAQRAGSVMGIESNTNLAVALTRQLSASTQIVIFNTDFLTFPLPTGPYKVFSNPPFSIINNIIRKLLFDPNPPQDCYLILQNEAAQKYLTTGGSHTMISVLLFPWWEISVIHRLKRTDFYPVPSVDSSLIRISLRPNPHVSPQHASRYRDAVVSHYTHAPQAKFRPLSYWLSRTNWPSSSTGSFNRWLAAQSTLSKIHRTRTDPHWKHYRS